MKLPNDDKSLGPGKPKMDIHARLVTMVSEATSPADALKSAALLIAEELRAQGCSIFIRGRDGTLDLRASSEFEDDDDARVATRTLAGKALGEVLPLTSEILRWALVAAPVASLNRPIGAIVARRAGSAPFAAEEIMRLSGVASQMVAVIESAQLVETIAGAATARSVQGASKPAPSIGERVLEGVAASPGIALGIATFHHAFPRALVRRETAYQGPTIENGRVRDAFQKTRNDLLVLQSAAASEIGEEHALIFGAHLLMLKDPMLADLVGGGIARGRPAAASVNEALQEIVERLRNTSDAYLQERIEDIEDLRTRILGHLVGPAAERVGDSTRVIVSSNTSPSLVIELKARGALGIASELGGATSHGVLLARALGVPAVTGVDRLTHEVLPGDVLVIDGDDGRVVIRPTAKTTEDVARRVEASHRKRTEFLRYRDEPTRTADGVLIDLQANIALSADLEVARENRANGIGLYRTEFLYIVREGLPTVEAQARVYAKAYAAFPDAPVTLRLLDLGPDKFLPGRELPGSRDAFHGYRSIRILFDYPHVLRDQVQAFAVAARGRPLRILVPMVSSVEDIVRIKQLVASALLPVPSAFARGALTYGAMIETPAAAEIVTELAREVDFFSIGTNDLIQYALVVDREDARLSSERHAYHPAILRMIRRVAEHAHGAGRRVTVCGEMATRPDLAIALIAVGVDALSVTPRVIPELRQAFARVALEPLRASIDRVLAASTADEVESALHRYVQDGELLPSGPAT